MAQRVITKLVDDIDGTELSGGSGETLVFALDGTAYEIDLSNDNANQFRQALRPYIEQARQLGKSSNRPSRRGRDDTRRDPAQTQHIREWAKASGLRVSDRGRIPAGVVGAYEAAHRGGIGQP